VGDFIGLRYKGEFFKGMWQGYRELVHEDANAWLQYTNHLVAMHQQAGSNVPFLSEYLTLVITK